MITVNNVSLRFGKRTLFENVVFCISNSEKCFCMGRRFDVAVVDIPGKG